MRIVAPWVIVKQDGPMVCTRCGEEYELPLPCLISVWVAATRAFLKAHSGCHEAKR